MSQKLVAPVAKVPKVKKRVARPRHYRTSLEKELDKQAAEMGGIMSRAHKRMLLHVIAHDRKADIFARIRAIETDNKMAGHNEPDKVEVGLSATLMEALRGGADE